MTLRRCASLGLLGIAIAIGIALPARADSVVTSPAGLSIFQITSGPFSGIDPSDYYSAMAFDPSGNYLLLAINSGTTAQSSPQGIYEMQVDRNGDGEITGFGTPSLYATVNTTVGAVNNGVGGGLIEQSGGSLLYTTNPSNYVGSYSGGSSSLTSYTGLAPYTLGGLQYVPASFTNNGAGLLKISTSNPQIPAPNGEWYTIATVGGPVSGGTGGPEADSFVYALPDADSVPEPAVLIEDASTLTLSLYGLDSQGNPTTQIGSTWVASSQMLNFGIARDPRLPEYLFSTADGSIWAVEEDVPEPGTLLLIGVGLLAVIARRR